MLEHLLENAKAKRGPDHPESLDLTNDLATACRRAGDWQRAMRLLEQVVEKDKVLRGPVAAGASDAAFKIAMIYQDAGLHQESASRLDKVYELRKITGGSDSHHLMTVRARAYQRAGMLDKADLVLRELLAIRRKKGEGLRIQLIRPLQYLSLNLLLQNRPAEAELLAREALAFYEKNPNCDFEWQGPYVINLLGGTLLGQKKYAEAGPLLLQGYEGMKQVETTIVAQERYRLAEAGERVIRYYEETNQPEKARAWREKVKPKLPDATSNSVK